MRTFKCHKCGRQSKFLDQCQMLLLESLTAYEPNNLETRTYECEFCSSENEINLTRQEWTRIDASDGA